MHRPTTTFLVPGALALAACALETDPGQISASQDPLYGRVEYDGATCTEELRDYLDESMFYGRTAANSDAFAQCVDQRMRALYVGCAGDPWNSSAIATQVGRAIDASRTSNDVFIYCNGGDPAGLAWAGIGSYGTHQDETFQWSQWLENVASRMDLPVCGTPGADPANCRFAAWPWPWSQSAGVTWHEVMHQHGYGHDSCGITDPGWNFQVNTVPYIVGGCIAEVINASGEHCGDTPVCGDSARYLVDGYGSTSCECVDDPWMYVDLWSTRFANPAGGYPHASITGTISYADVTGDGNDELCGFTGSNVTCWGSDGVGFEVSGRNPWSSAATTFGASWGSAEYYWKTIQFPDVNGDGRADVCGRGSAGIWCQLSDMSTGRHRFLPGALWSSSYSNANGWHADPAFYETIGFPDLDGDGKADVCGRGNAGIWCGLSSGSKFLGNILMSTAFSDANAWRSHASYWSTIQYGDVDDDGHDDVCGRGTAGMYCARYRHLYRDFGPAKLFTSQFSNAAGWTAPQYYSTVKLADINGDGAMDVCGRGGAGVYCGVSTGTSFSQADVLDVSAFSDANGWDRPEHYGTMHYVDVDGDGRAEVCGRGDIGIHCAHSRSYFWPVFDVAQLWVRNFGDDRGWGATQKYWGTVKPARVSRAHPDGHAFCGRGAAGIYCSRR